MRVIILAHGVGTRLPNLPTPKQLTLIGGEPICARTVRLLRAHGLQEITVIAQDTKPWQDFSARTFVPVISLLQPTLCILETIYCTRDLWDSREPTVMLLGDVVFSSETLHKIVHRSQLTEKFFSGTREISAGAGELFSFTFHPEHHAKLPQQLKESCGGSHEIGQHGHLRNLMWRLHGKKFSQRGPSEALPTQYLVIDDWTKDIDTEADLSRLFELEAHIKEEGSGPPAFSPTEKD